MLINLDATQLLCMPIFCSDACRDLSKRVGRVNTSCYIRYMTRSIKLLRPTSIPGYVDMCSIMQSMAMQKRAGARIHPCLTLDVVRNLPCRELLTNPNSSNCGFVQGRNEVE